MKIGIVGMGWVGSSIAISVLHSGLARELLLNDLKPGLAEGEAMDLVHGATLSSVANIREAAVEEMHDADAIVVAAGRGGNGNESRLDLLRDNVELMRDITSRLAGTQGLLIIVTNPVDVMTHVAVEASSLPPSRVIGTGTMLDTARLRQAVGRELGLSPRSIHAQVVGEHGDSEVFLWSSASIGGLPLRDYQRWGPELENRLAREVRTAAYEIIRRKGATNHAIGMVTASLLKSLLHNEGRVLTVSKVQENVLGCEGVALSLPAVVGQKGIVEVLACKLDATESNALARSASILRQAIASVS